VGTEERHRLGSSLGSTLLAVVMCFLPLCCAKKVCVGFRCQAQVIADDARFVALPVLTKSVVVLEGWVERYGKVERWSAEDRETVKLYAPRSLHVHGLVACLSVLKSALGSGLGTGVCDRVVVVVVVVKRIEGNRRMSCLQMCAEDIYIYIYQTGRYSTFSE